MYDVINAQLAEARERIARRAELKASLIPARERLTDQAHVVKGIEDCLATVQDEIQSLESFTIKSLIKSITWKKESTLNQLREEAFDLAPQVEIGEQMLLELEAAVKEIEAEMASLSNAEETYKALCEQKGELILADDGEPAVHLHEIAAQIKAVKNDRQSLRKCLQIAKSLMERLRTMSRAVNRVKGKMLQHVGLGAIGSAFVHVVHRQGSEGAVRRAEDGLSELSHSIEKLNLQHGCERDAELARVGVMLSHSHADIGGVGTTVCPVRNLICKATDLLQSKLDEVEPAFASLDARRIEIIEKA